MNWILLILGGLFEVGFTTCLNKAKTAASGEAGLWWLGFAGCLTLSMVLLYQASKTIPMGTAYAVWTGIGALGTVVTGIVWFNEPAELKRLFFLTMLVGSIIGLKWVSATSS